MREEGSAATGSRHSGIFCCFVLHAAAAVREKVPSPRGCVCVKGDLLSGGIREGGSLLYNIIHIKIEEKYGEREIILTGRHFYM